VADTKLNDNFVARPTPKELVPAGRRASLSIALRKR
jgi:hypothetical protein